MRTVASLILVELWPVTVCFTPIEADHALWHLTSFISSMYEARSAKLKTCIYEDFEESWAARDAIISL